jgi:hypothetical protein
VTQREFHLNFPEFVAGCDDVRQAEDILARNRAEANGVLSSFCLSVPQSPAARYSECAINAATRVDLRTVAHGAVLGVDQKMLDTNVAITPQPEAATCYIKSQSGAGRDVLGAA